MRGILETVRKRSFRSLASRVTFFVLLATLLSSLLVSWVSIRSIQSFLLQKIDQKFPAILSATRERLDLWYGQRRLDVEIFARSAIVAGNLPRLAPSAPPRAAARAKRELGEYLTYVLEHSAQYEALFILDPDAEELFWVGDEVEVPDSLRAQLGQVTGSRTSDIYRLVGRRVQVVSAAVNDHREQRLGSLHALLRTESVDELLRSESLGPSGRIHLVGRGGTYLAPLGEQPPAGSYSRPLPEPGAPTPVEEYASESGQSVIGSAMGLEKFDWTLVVEEPAEEAFEPAAAALRKVLGLNLAIVTLFSLIAFRVALSILRPIQALSKGAKRIAEGETEVMIPGTSSQDELALLTQTFNRMSTRLHRNRIELQESRLNIESANVRLRGQNEELQRMNEALEQLSITDGLTRLYNHRFFQEHLAHEIARVQRSGAPLALILIDIDNFKQLNDRLGHAAGDRVLCEVARVMSRLVRESDVLARYGGEEFALVPSQASLEGALGMAEKIRLAIAEQEMRVEDEGTPVRLHVTVSIGVARYRGDRKAFFNDADRALYRAKAAGKDCVMVETGGETDGEEAES